MRGYGHRGFGGGPGGFGGPRGFGGRRGWMGPGYWGRGWFGPRMNGCFPCCSMFLLIPVLVLIAGAALMAFHYV